jgi:MFS family permease
VAGLPSTFWVLFAGTLINKIGGFVYTFLMLYLTAARQMPVEQASAIVALYGAGSFLAAMVGGHLADRIGRRTTLLIGLWGGAAMMLLLGQARQVPAIAAATFGLALIQDMYRPAVNAMVADLVPPDDRPRAFGLIYWAINMGFAISAVLAGVMATRSYQWLFIGDAATTALYGVLIFLKVPETRPAEAARQGGSRASDLAVPFRDTVFITFIGICFLVLLLFFQSHVALPLDMKQHGLSESTYGVLVAINGVMIVLVQPFASRLVQRYRRSAVMALSAALVGIGFGLPALAPVVPVYAVGIVIWTLGEIIAAPVGPSIVSDLAPVELRGTYQGLYHTAWGLASCVSPAISGWVMRTAEPRALWIASVFIGLVAAAGQLAIAPPRRRRLIALRAEARQVSAVED